MTSLYLLATTFALVVMHRYNRRFNMQLSINVLIDVLVITSLIHAGEGLRSGLGVMLLVTLTGAGLVGQGRLVLFYAALATLSVLFEQSYRALSNDFDAAGFFQTGVFSIGFFAVAISARLLARRVIANEELARQRGVDLENQTLISQRVIEEMQDGVLVLNQNGWVKQHNPRAERLLGLGGTPEAMLSSYSPELAQGFLIGVSVRAVSRCWCGCRQAACSCAHGLSRPKVRSAMCWSILRTWGDYRRRRNNSNWRHSAVSQQISRTRFAIRCRRSAMPES